MNPDDVVDRVIEDITDGTPIDWASLENDPGFVQHLGWLQALRVLSDVATVHRAPISPFILTSMAGAGSDSLHHGLEKWGKYVLEQKIGQGSFGDVYRAWDPELELHRAIKILHRHVIDARLRDRLLREGRALAKVSHENVVKVIAVEAHEDRVALCMEFVRGETLAEVVATRGPLDARDAALIGQALCGALLAVHRAGFIHRDVKAKNVMREEGSGRIVLMDFGTGRAADRPELQGDLAGTPLYMAPEVLEGEPASACSDTYSLGVLLYHLVTAAYPVEAGSIEELRDAHAQRRHRLLSERRSDLPIPFMQIIERAIAADPDERYLDASELLDALDTLKLGTSRVAQGVRWGLTAAAAVAVLPAIGFLTSSHFNILLERGDFVSETLTSSVRWGRMSSVPPLFLLLLTLLGIAPFVVARRILVASSARMRRFDNHVRQRCARAAHRLRLDEVHVLASCVLALSSSAVVASWWYFLPLLTALVTRVSTGRASDLALLSPSLVTYHNQYRVVFGIVVICAVAMWIPVVKLARKGQPLHRGLWVGGAVVTCVALVFLHFPYRLLYFNKVFEAVRWNGAFCYVIGERPDDMLLMCPEIETPRNRIVRRADADVVRLGIQESLFTRFRAPAP